MPAAQPDVLINAILRAVQESGYSGTLISSPRTHPRRFSINSTDENKIVVSAYIWTLTFGGRPKLQNEYRIQMTSVKPPLSISAEGPTVLLGYEPSLNLFAGFDLSRHRTFTTGSPSVQIDIEVLQQAEVEGMSFHRKSNDEIAVGVRPDRLMDYILHADTLHRFGREPDVLPLLTRAASLAPIAPQEIAALSAERRRIIQQVSRLSRLGSFRRQVLFAYGNRCAVTRVQLGLVDAAHILPVGAPSSSDDIQNGIALSPTYHRAFDNGLIYLDDEYRMRLNIRETEKFEKLNLQVGLDFFRAPLGKIFLPPDRSQWPSAAFIRRANQFRHLEI